MIESMAKSFPRLPESVDLPNKSVMKAPAKTPVIFITPYAVALDFEETN